MMLSREMAKSMIAKSLVEKGKAESTSLASQVYETLLDMLISNQIPPGTILNRREVANSLKVSVAPVLEAFNRLEWEGYLQTLPRKGTIVVIPDSSDVMDNLVAREALEVQAARIICGDIVKKNYEKLLPLAIELDSTFISVDRSNITLENQFHGMLMKLTENKALISMHEMLLEKRLFYSIHETVMYQSSSSDRHLDTHQGLLLKLESDNPDEAEKAIRIHLGTTRFAIESVRTK